MYEYIIPKNYNPNILFTGPIMSKISFLATVLERTQIKQNYVQRGGIDDYKLLHLRKG